MTLVEKQAAMRLQMTHVNTIAKATTAAGRKRLVKTPAFKMRRAEEKQRRAERRAHRQAFPRSKYGVQTPEYSAYAQAKGRCLNPRHPAYKNYGGRGIRFLFTSFEQFYAELGKRPEGKLPSGHAKYSVNRKENDGHYETGNVEWSTQKEQCSNRRRSSAMSGDVRH
jgi:hypothetical protein